LRPSKLAEFGNTRILVVEARSQQDQAVPARGPIVGLTSDRSPTSKIGPFRIESNPERWSISGQSGHRFAAGNTTKHEI
jgi:hypothetical protein